MNATHQDPNVRAMLAALDAEWDRTLVRVIADALEESGDPLAPHVRRVADWNKRPESLAGIVSGEEWAGWLPEHKAHERRPGHGLLRHGRWHSIVPDAAFALLAGGLHPQRETVDGEPYWIGYHAYRWRSDALLALARAWLACGK